MNIFSVTDKNILHTELIKLIETCHEEGFLISSKLVNKKNKDSIIASFEKQFKLRPRVQYNGLHRHIEIDEIEIGISFGHYRKLIEHHVKLIGFQKQQYVAYLLVDDSKLHLHIIFNRATGCKGNLIDANYPECSHWNSIYKVKCSYEAIVNEYYRAEQQQLNYRRDIEQKVRQLVEYSSELTKHDIQLNDAINRINQVLRKMASDL
ncbi:MAG: hypothetical protein KME64_35265 [Scytonematopsis contorta HA4267-MV1]|jgi:hypothetical protein|nr:hypothetical protein [Scytonematopsis contorta HA4267-MV1]